MQQTSTQPSINGLFSASVESICEILNNIEDGMDEHESNTSIRRRTKEKELEELLLNQTKENNSSNNKHKMSLRTKVYMLACRLKNYTNNLTNQIREINANKTKWNKVD